MDPQLEELLRAAEKAVAPLIEACQKSSPLYQRGPKTVAQVSRTGKWLLNAVGALRQTLDASANDDQTASEVSPEDEG
jgi:hypothetical protein